MKSAISYLAWFSVIFAIISLLTIVLDSCEKDKNKAKATLAAVATQINIWAPTKMITTDNNEPFTAEKIVMFTYNGHTYHHDANCEACEKSNESYKQRKNPFQVIGD